MAHALDLEVLSVVTRLSSEFVDWLTEKFLREDLESLITEDGVWKAFVEAAELSSDEQAALHDALEDRLTQEPKDENENLEWEQQKKRYLKEFPGLKRKLEDHIRKLRDLADHLDQVHKGCTISNVVTSSVGIVSVLGGALAPLTGGASLLVSAASAGLGAAAGVTGLTTSVVEESTRMSDEAEARRLVGASKNIVEEIYKLLPKFTFKSINTGVDLVIAWKTIGQLIRNNRTARGRSLSRTQARNLRTAPQGSRQVRRALPHSAHQVTRRARIRGVAFAGILLALDSYHLVTDSMDLSNGATTKSGGALRDLAQELKEKLQGFEKIHKNLQSDPPQ